MRIKAVVASLLVVVFMLAVTSPTKGDEGSGATTEQFLGMCKEPAESRVHTFCAAYVMGIADMMQLFSVETIGDARKNFGMCASKPYPSGNAEVQAFINWAEKHPKTWGEPKEITVIWALSDTWPCEATKAAK